MIEDDGAEDTTSRHGGPGSWNGVRGGELQSIICPPHVRVGSNSAVSRFLRHGCFTPETGHCLARPARPKSAIQRTFAPKASREFCDAYDPRSIFRTNLRAGRPQN